MKIEKCPVCGKKSSENRLAYSQGLIYLQCQLCTAFYQNFYMTSKEAQNYYETSYRKGMPYEKKLKKSLREGIKEIEFPMKASILEIGSDAGGTIIYLKSKGHNVESVEIYGENAKRIESHGIKVYNDILENIDFGGQKYDYIIALEVLEHFTNPKGCVEKIHSLLTDDGYFVFQTPIMTWQLLVSKGFNDFSVPHFCVFTVEALKYLLSPLFELPEIKFGSGTVYMVKKKI